MADKQLARYQFDGDMRTPAYRTAPPQPASDDAEWTGYSAPTVTPEEAAHLFDYELSAYSPTVGYCADGIEMVCPIRKRP